MELSKRLTWIIEKINNVDVVADIGTDHGYIPIYLIKNKIAKKVIACDINKDPLNKAKINAGMEGVIEKIDLRLGSGLCPIKNKEAEIALIAGMGGNLIRDILENDLEKVKNLEYLLLQPAQNPEVLRKYLYNNDYEVIDEDICFDENKYYEIFKVRYKNVYHLSMKDIFYEISPLMIKKKLPLLRSYIEDKIEKNKKIMDFIRDDTEHAIIRKNELQERNDRLQELLKNF